MSIITTSGSALCNNIHESYMNFSLPQAMIFVYSYYIINLSIYFAPLYIIEIIELAPYSFFFARLSTNVFTNSPREHCLQSPCWPRLAVFEDALGLEIRKNYDFHNRRVSDLSLTSNSRGGVLPR